MKHTPMILASAAVLACVLCAPAVEAAKPLKMGVVPQWAASRLAKAWIPMLGEINKRTGVELEFATAPDIDEFHKRVNRGDYDFIYINPLYYVYAHDKQGYEAIIKQKNKRLKGILVVRTESPYKSVSDLKGKRVALPAPSAFAAHILNLGILADAGVTPKKDGKLQVVSSHDSAYLLVYRNEADVAGGVGRTFNSMPENIRRELRILNTSKGFMPHPIAVHPRVPKETAEKVQRAIVAIGADPASKDMLGRLKLPNGFEIATDADYADSREFDAKMKASELAASK